MTIAPVIRINLTSEEAEAVKCVLQGRIDRLNETECNVTAEAEKMRREVLLLECVMSEIGGWL